MRRYYFFKKEKNISGVKISCQTHTKTLAADAAIIGLGFNIKRNLARLFKLHYADASVQEDEQSSSKS